MCSSVDEDRLVNWVLRHHQAPTGWVNLVGRKSLHLNKLLATTTLLLFAPRQETFHYPCGTTSIDLSEVGSRV
jgi:hypothetical protein